jgi:hypothetical protein
MKKCRLFIACAVTMTAVVIAAAGCGGTGTKVDFTKSGRNPVIIYERTPAFPPTYNAQGPDLIIYGNGATFRITGPAEIKRGSFTDAELRGLLTAIVNQGFFNLHAKGANPPTGGDTDHLTVTLKDESKSVSAGAATATSPFKDIVQQLRDLKIPNEREYIPDNLVLYSSVFQGTPPSGAKVLTWNLDPKFLQNSSEAKTSGIGVSGTDAQAVWKALRDSSGSPDEVFWVVGNKVYARVVAIPQFPLPGV